MTTKPPEEKNNEEVLLSFLERTKEGNYAPIDENTLIFTRITEESERIDHPEEEYYYYSIG